MNKLFSRVSEAKVIPVSQKVNTFIVGAQKGGTSSLYNFIIQSPTVAGTVAKEVMYFSHDKNFVKGEQWYIRQFKQPLRKLGKKINCIIDATPEYMYYDNCAERIYQYNPEAKIIFILRDPIYRAFSHWNMYRQFHETNKKTNWLIERHLSLLDDEFASPLISLFNEDSWPTFEKCIELELNQYADSQEPSFIKRGIYIDQIEAYLNDFSEEQIFVGFSEDLKNDPKTFLTKISEFLEIKMPAKMVFNSVHERTYDSHLNEAAKDQLLEYFRPHNERLQSLLRTELPW